MFFYVGFHDIKTLQHVHCPFASCHAYVCTTILHFKKFLVCKIYWTMMSIRSSILLWWLGIGQYDKCNYWAYLGIAKLCKILHQTLVNPMVVNKFLCMMLPCYYGHSPIYLFVYEFDWFCRPLILEWLVLGVQFHHHKCLCLWAIVVHVFFWFKCVWSLHFVCIIMQFTIWIQM